MLFQIYSSYVHWVGDAIQPSHLLLSPSAPPSIFPSIRVFSNESTLHIRWPNYWSFNFSISLSNDQRLATCLFLRLGRWAQQLVLLTWHGRYWGAGPARGRVCWGTHHTPATDAVWAWRGEKKKEWRRHPLVRGWLRTPQHELGASRHLLWSREE